ncbi:hypothetical protein N0V84_011138 [Fusarium piperis]|uniref:Uncharacterized protein n=1 Tax=Fusarium piperis TaxID=1435070 RepID=A0A9W8TAZ3_9HYPO|nr:hypothetical protein N0V84_011138 [Fusarium piperis]
MALDSTSIDARYVNGDSVSDDYSSMLLPFIHDTSSFSDRQVQIANGGATSASTHDAAPSRPTADASNQNEENKESKENKENKDDKPMEE